MSYLQYLDYGNSNDPLQVLSFHGFPAIRSKQNREIADNVARELKSRVRVVLYPGLSTDGVFSFEKTIDGLLSEFTKLAEDRNKKFEQVDLIGHSFGGFCSILLAAKFPTMIRRMVLLSPLLRFASSLEQAKMFFANILKNADSIKTLPSHELAAEFQHLASRYKVEDLIQSFDPKLQVKFMQARTDQITPTAIAEEFRKYFTGNFTYELVDQDHSFLSDRLSLSKKIAKFF